MPKSDVTKTILGCSCALPALTGSTECCEHCQNHKDWQTYNDYIKDVRELDKAIDLANDESHLKDLEDKRLGRPSWQETFFEIAKVIAKRSKDPHTKVGSVLVKDGHVLGVGYNGEPREFTYEFDWTTSEKYDFVIHAELNAIANACAIGANVAGADIYLTLSPCHECMKLLIQHRIRRVFYLEEYRDFEKTKLMSEHSGVQLIKC